VSLSAGVVPAAFKSAYTCPLLKKPDLDTADTKNYRPMLNLTVVFEAAGEARRPAAA